MKYFSRIFISIALILVFILAPVACNANNKNDPDNFSGEINIATLGGTTGFGMAKLMSDAKNSDSDIKYNVEVQSSAEEISKSLIKGDLDIAALPTNAAANLHAKTSGGIKILAVNTLGVLYVVVNENNSNIKSLSDLEGKQVYCPAQNPTFIFKGLCDKAGVNVVIDNSFSTPEELQTAIISGAADIAVLPEPLVTVVKSKNKALTVALDLTAEWDKVFPEGSLMQGCVVARTSFIEQFPEAVEKFLEDYKASVNYVNENPEDAAKLIANAGIVGNENVAKAAIPNCNIKYVDGTDMATALDVFFNTLYKINPKSVGEKLPNASIYYNGNS